MLTGPECDEQYRDELPTGCFCSFDVGWTLFCGRFSISERELRSFELDDHSTCG